MPFDRNDLRDEMPDRQARSAARCEPDDDLSGALAALFEMFGGRVMEPAPQD